MPVIKTQGLKGLPGLNRLSDKERQAFYKRNEGILNLQNFSGYNEMDQAAEILYNNQQFIKKFGKENFNKYNDHTEASYNLRNNLLFNTLVAEEGNRRYNPFKSDDDKQIDSTKGFGNLNDWIKFNDMSPEGQLQLMESDYQTTPEFEAQWKKRKQEYDDISSNNPFNKIIDPYTGIQGTPYDEGTKQRRKERNDNIFQHIYNDDLKKQTHQLGNEVSAAYQQIADSDLNDDQIKKSFYDNFVNEDSELVKNGAGEYASHWGFSEMKKFGVDDMRQALAKLHVYSQHMSPSATATAINNEAKEYIKDHQGDLKRFGLFAKDVGISTLSYSADKVNGFYGAGLAIADLTSDTPVVWMDDEKNVVDPHTKFYKRGDGKICYQDANGEQRIVHRAKVRRWTLHNMGRNFDGSEDQSILNPQYWTRAEQFGTLDADLQKKYEKLGSSPYKVAYDPNEESSLWYEAFKMASFGIADALSLLIPWGIGLAGTGLRTVSMFGKAGQAFGSAMQWTGRMLSAESKVGQFIQGGAGAAGIAYAYNRGAFQETLAQNLARAEETLDERSRKEVYDRYYSDAEYKASVDAQINNLANLLTIQQLKQASRDGQKVLADGVKAQAKEQATEEIINQLIQARTQELKETPEWEQLQDKAIQGAGNAALNTYWPEAIKYGLVNTVGFRKWLYTNPTGTAKKVYKGFKGIKEITTQEGRQRLALEARKFLTNKDKWKQLGKTAASQAWGGAWTNGTDDMMTDAAERINQDSYDQYINGFLHGNAIADTYGLADGLYSYWNGLMNSTGQQTTLNATAVGALGSVVSFSPNMVNIARLATKRGRAEYRNNFRQQFVRNNDGTIKRDENGQPLLKKKKWNQNLGGKFSYFIQNGVLSSYYGKQQAERDLQSHADYVNNILDDYNDFQDINDLIAADQAISEATNKGDEKTVRFIKAIKTIRTLDNLANDDKDPTTLSSVITKEKSLIETLSQMDFDPTKDNIPEDDSVKSLMKQYYSQNPNETQNPLHDKEVLATLIHNAKELKEASDAYQKAEVEIQKAEQNAGHPFDYVVRERLKLQQALNGHWTKRLNTMKDEIGDHSTEANGELPEDVLLASVGGFENGKLLLKAYERQEKELEQDQEKAEEEVQSKEKKLADAQKVLTENQDEGKTLELQKQVNKAEAELGNAKMQQAFVKEQLLTTRRKRSSLFDANLHALEEKDYQDRVLTADEIMALDPITRARMMREENRDFYSDAQKAEIEKLEHQLLMKDTDALQKIQDIALLTQRLHTNVDAHSRILSNPEAAAIQLEAQREAAAMSAYHLINQKNAHVVTEWVNNMDESLAPYEDITQKDKEDYVYRELRRLNPTLLDILDEEQLLPKYQKQVQDAKAWSKIVTDIDAVISRTEGTEEHQNHLKDTVHQIVELAQNKDEILSLLDKAIDDTQNAETQRDLESILQSMEKMGYQRDATVLENRKKRKEREEAQQKQEEESQQKAQQAAKEAAEKASQKPAAQKGKNTSPQLKWDDTEPEHIIEEGKVEPVEGSFEGVQGLEGKEETEGKEENPPKKADSPAESAESSAQGEGLPPRVTIKDDIIQGRMETLEEQHAEDTSSDGKTSTLITNTPEGLNQNEIGERKAEKQNNTLSGNAMSEYKPQELVEQGKLVHKQGASPTDSMSRFYKWMESAGIHLQNIVDDELGQILQMNPHAKVKFMAVNPQGKGTDDVAMQTHLLLVLDYDDTLNKGIKTIHKESNGGVVKTQGKEYLIIGVAGYSRNNTAQRDLYDILFSNNPRSPHGYGIMKLGRAQFFDAHPEERFWVNDEITTEIPEDSLIPGYVVRQLEGDKEAQYRPITELLTDERRNPRGYTLRDLSWGIQTYGDAKVLLVGPGKGSKFHIEPSSVRNVRNQKNNVGSVFVIIPNASGNFFPAYIKPLYYNEMRDGALKDEIMQVLNDFTSTDYQTRSEAISRLSQIFLTSTKDGDGFLSRKSRAEVSLIHSGIVFKTFVLDENFDRRAFMEAIADMNPRINITKWVLGSTEQLKKYEEAGALDTDLAKLGTAGASFSIYGVDANGKMLKPEVPPNNEHHKESSSDASYRNSHRQQVVYQRKYYIRIDGTYYLEGIPVTDEALIKQLDINRQISSLKPTEKDTQYDYYVLSSGENPQVIRVNQNTKVAEELAPEQAKEALAKAREMHAEEQRRRAAKDALKNSLKNADTVKLHLDEEHPTGEQPAAPAEEPASKNPLENEKEESKEENKKEEGPKTSAPTSPQPPKSPQNLPATQTFEQLYKSPKYKIKLIKLIKNKWPDAPKSLTELAEYMRKKNVEVDTIGTSPEAVEAWIKTVEECR